MVSTSLVVAATLAAPLSVTLFGCGGGGPGDSTTAGPGDSTTTAPASTSPGEITTTPMVAGQCAPVMPNVDCSGYDMKMMLNVNSTEDCCAQCTKTENCGAYSHQPLSGICVLKRWCDYLVAKEGYHSSMPLALPETPPPGCVEPELGIGFNCEGEGTEEIAVVNGDSQHDCCDVCSKTPGCLIYSFSMSQKSCSLKKNCPVKPPNADYITGWVVNPEQQKAARYQVGRGYYELEGYQCGGSNPATVIFYPRGDGPFSVVVYGHGAWGYVDGSDDWLETVASLGLIVIAPFQGKDPKPCKSAFADDLLNALQGSKAGGATLHPALGTATWEKTGIFGHSKGAKYAPLAASKGKDSHGVSAVVCSCDAPSDHYDVTVPTMFTTGTLDKFNADNQILKYWEESTAEPKVYVNLRDAYHMEVQEGMRLNLLSGQFLSCHVAGNKEDCDVIYGTTDGSICKENAYADGQCCVQQGPERIDSELCTTTTTTLSTSTLFPPTTTTTTAICVAHWGNCLGEKTCCDTWTCVPNGNGNYAQCKKPVETTTTMGPEEPTTTTMGPVEPTTTTMGPVEPTTTTMGPPAPAPAELNNFALV